MERSIGFERTLKTKEYESVKVSSFVGEIPFHLWSQEGFTDKLYQLLAVQAYKALVSTSLLHDEVMSYGKDNEARIEYLNNTEKLLYEILDIKELQIETEVKV